VCLLLSVTLEACLFVVVVLNVLCWLVGILGAEILTSVFSNRIPFVFVYFSKTLKSQIFDRLERERERAVQWI
jgi:hypothetical protein